MNAEEDLIEAKRSQLAATAAQLQADFAVQKEQVEHLRQKKIAANAEALAENEARQQSLERQLAAINSNVSDHEISEESLDQQISDFTQRKITLTQELADIGNKDKSSNRKLDSWMKLSVWQTCNKKKNYPKRPM